MRMIEVSGSVPNQSSGGRPTMRARKAKSPLTGCISRFFQTSALTVGMTKKGEIISTRAMPRPGKRRLEQGGEHRAEADRDEQHAADEHRP